MVCRFITGIVFAVCLAVTGAATVGAAESEGRGLYVSPLRHEIDVRAGGNKTGYLTVANNTEKQMTVSISVKEFSVTDYTYNHKFVASGLDWIKPDVDKLILQPKQKQQVRYDVAVPANMGAGGYYFSLLTSTTVSSGTASKTIQAATLLYLTVDGDKARTEGLVQNERIPWLVTGLNMPYQFDFQNTGNIHLNGYFFARLDGVFGQHAQMGSHHISMPETTRKVEGALSSPMLPGIYQLTYGYKADSAAADAIVKSMYIIVIPPWSLVALIFVALTGRWLWQKKSHKGKREN